MDCFDILHSRINNRTDYDIKINIKSKINIDKNTIYFIAANPPDYRTSFSGSALYFYNKEQAFFNTTNTGYVNLDKNDECAIYLKLPNSYYIDLGNILVAPYVDLIYTINGKKNVFTHKLSDDPIPYRSLSHPYTRTCPLFYQEQTQRGVMSQSDLLIKTGFPSKNKSLEDFWI
tara:strand:+ start:679 stop:1200 length:522 start_codon:yes stop_codon:yes gene_type:complete